MKPDFPNLMARALRLTREGDLPAATAAIQAALRGDASSMRAPSHEAGWVIDVEAREVPSERPGDDELPQPASRGDPPAAGRFVAGSHGEGAGRLDYKLYIPPDAGGRPLPLVVMLHGCTQDPDDFAAGTAMNEAACSRGVFVLYPAQSARANPQRCWNWFKHSHQERGRGEPGWIAAMVREVMACHAIDSRRVYAAGLSAGGAMAAILGEVHGDLFAAVGVHSGLAAGVASDLPSALAAMKDGRGRGRAAAGRGTPTIVFHGDADVTVHPGNGESIIAACVGERSVVEAETSHRPGGRSWTRRVHRASDGRVLAEHWSVHGAGHAWSGGRPQGSHTDAGGPDATAEMLRFFMEHPRED